jgi:hypothetical protein
MTQEERKPALKAEMKEIIDKQVKKVYEKIASRAARSAGNTATGQVTTYTITD